jgi:hypothetical protein
VDSEFTSAQGILQGYLQTLSGYLNDYASIVTYLADQDKALYSTALSAKIADQVNNLTNLLTESSEGKPELISQYIQVIDQCDGVLYE